jgi:hypothetical protein
MFFIRVVDPFLREVPEFRTPDVMLDRVAFEQLNRLMGVNRIDRLENAD